MNFSDPSYIINEQVGITSLYKQQSRKETIREISEGLASEQKHISSSFFYDDRGSVLFEEITKLDEYYPTRTEMSILKDISHSLVKEVGEINIIELGSGDCSKISIILDAIPENRLSDTHYFPVDISDSAILKSAEFLAEKYVDIQIHGVHADFTKYMTELPGTENRLICFFGSTIGNFTRAKAENFLVELRHRMNPGDSLLLGLDMVKDVPVLEKAYNDKKGITAAFNKNILNAVNAIANTDFNTSDFKHVAFYNQEQRRIEMHLEAQMDIVVKSPNFPQSIYISKGEQIHTENSHKHTREDIEVLAEKSGLRIEQIFMDKNGYFSLVKYTCLE